MFITYPTFSSQTRRVDHVLAEMAKNNGKQWSRMVQRLSFSLALDNKKIHKDVFRYKMEALVSLCR